MNLYCAFRQRFSICCLKVNFLSIVSPSSKTPSLASTLIEFFLTCACDETYPKES